jgi:hypothetical protein
MPANGCRQKSVPAGISVPALVQHLEISRQTLSALLHGNARPLPTSALPGEARIQVLSPLLERHPSYEEGPIPHVYVNRADQSLPYLCLFDPFNGEWTPSDLLAETTVPWAARYLYFYEGWLLTGKWSGGGRHPTQEELDGTQRPKAIAAV